jgi:O-antigen/teichoic acid export membrane protein
VEEASSGDRPGSVSIEPDMASRVGRNALYNLLGQLGLLGLGLVAARFLFRGLGDDAFGLILFATAFSAVLTGLLELGLIATTVRAVAVHADDAPYLSDYVGTGTSLCWGLYGVLALAGWFLAPVVIDHWIHLRTLSPETATELLRVLLIASFSTIPRNLYSSLFRGMQRMEFNNAIELGAGALQQAGVVAILVLGGGAITVALWILLVAVLATGAYVIALSHFLDPIAMLPRYSRKVVLDHWRFAASVSGNSMLVALFMQSDKLVVSRLLPISAFGYYSFAWSSVWRVAALSTVVSQAAFPSIAGMSRHGATERLARQYHKLHGLVSHIFVVPMAAVAFGAFPVFQYLFGSTVAASLVAPVGLLSVAYYMYATLTMPMAVAAAAGRPELITRVNLIALFTFLPALVGLVAAWGLTGAAVAWLAYYLLTYAFLIPKVCSECLHESAWKWYGGILSVCAKVAVTYGVAWSLCFATYRYSTGVWMLGFVVATVLFTMLAHGTVARSLRGSLAPSSARGPGEPAPGTCL